MINIYTLGGVELKKKKRSRKEKLEDEGQLNLFSGHTALYHLPPKSYFEEAVRLDHLGSSAAREFYLKAAEHNEFPADAYCNLGILESDRGNIPGAFKYFLEALKLEPAHLEVHYNLANLYFEQNDFKLAELHYKIVLEFDPAETNVLYNLALLYVQIDEPTKAALNLETYIEICGEDGSSEAVEILNKINKSFID